MAAKSRLQDEVEKFLALPDEERLAIARDIVRKLIEAKRSKTAA